MDQPDLIVQIERLEQSIDLLESDDSPSTAKRLSAMRTALERARQQLTQLKDHHAKDIANRLSASLLLSPEEQLAALLEAWRAFRAPRLADLIDDVSLELSSLNSATPGDFTEFGKLADAPWPEDQAAIEALQEVPHELPLELEQILEDFTKRWSDGRRSDAKRDQDSERQILEAVYAAPDDDTPRLVLADWLSERKRPLGEFISLQISQTNTQRQDELSEHHWREWMGPIYVGLLNPPTFERGFPVAGQLAVRGFFSGFSSPVWRTFRHLDAGEAVASRQHTQNLAGLRSLRVSRKSAADWLALGLPLREISFSDFSTDAADLPFASTPSLETVELPGLELRARPSLQAQLKCLRLAFPGFRRKGGLGSIRRQIALAEEVTAEVVEISIDDRDYYWSPRCRFQLRRGDDRQFVSLRCLEGSRYLRWVEGIPESVESVQVTESLLLPPQAFDDLRTALPGCRVLPFQRAPSAAVVDVTSEWDSEADLDDAFQEVECAGGFAQRSDTYDVTAEVLQPNIDAVAAELSQMPRASVSVDGRKVARGMEAIKSALETHLAEETEERLAELEELES